jgi:hypothetical protein
MAKWNIKASTYHALKAWTERKSLNNFKSVYHSAFTGGNPIWRVWRILRNTISGRYKEMVVDYENSY